jgi:hypothetical protein
MKRRFTATQLSFLPGTNEARTWKLKAPPKQEEAVFMRQLQDAARLMGLPSIHLSYYCGNRFYKKCPHCGHVELVTCNKTNNGENAGHGDLIGIAWEIETKRDRNQAGDPFEPTDCQTATHEALRKAGIPVMVSHPGNLQATIQFLKNLSHPGI